MNAPHRLGPAAEKQVSGAQAATAVALVAGAACLAAVAFSRVTGWIAGGVALPVGTVSLIAAIVLTGWAPRRFGWQWGESGRQWRQATAAIAGVVAVVTLYRLTGASTPYRVSTAELVVVPIGEEGLFRGFVLTILLALFRRWLPPASAVQWAVVVSALSSGVGHLGNLGYVPNGFVLLQVAAAIAFGMVAGWLRVRTGSLVAPVLGTPR